MCGVLLGPLKLGSYDAIEIRLLLLLLVVCVCVCVCVQRKAVMGKRENSDGQSMASAASSSRRSAAAGSVDATQPVPQSSAVPTAVPSSSALPAAGAPAAPAAARKSGRLFSLRRMLQDVQQQRLGSSRRQQRRSAPHDLPMAAVDTPPPAGAADSGWYTPTAASVEALDAVSAAAGGDDVSETGGGDLQGTMVDCTLCALSQPRSCFARVTAACGHRACVDCLRRYLTIEIMESRVNVECPACPERLHPNDVRRLLGSDAAELVSKYEEFALRRLLVHDPDARWCPAPDCGFVDSSYDRHSVFSI